MQVIYLFHIILTTAVFLRLPSFMQQIRIRKTEGGSRTIWVTRSGTWPRIRASCLGPFAQCLQKCQPLCATQAMAEPRRVRETELTSVKVPTTQQERTPRAGEYLIVFIAVKMIDAPANANIPYKTNGGLAHSAGSSVESYADRLCKSASWSNAPMYCVGERCSQTPSRSLSRTAILLQNDRKWLQ